MAKYSKKKHLREIKYRYDNDPKYRSEMDEIGCYFWGIAFVLVVIIFFIIAFVSGTEEAVDWVK